MKLEAKDPRNEPQEGRTLLALETIRGLIPRIRERMGLTQEKFAARLGVTFPTINRWENGHTRPSPLALKQIEALLRELGAEGDDLLREYFGQSTGP